MSGQGVRLVVICSDATHLVNAGLDVEMTARTFDLPPEIAQYISENAGPYRTIAFAIDRTDPRPWAPVHSATKTHTTTSITASAWKL